MNKIQYLMVGISSVLAFSCLLISPSFSAPSVPDAEWSTSVWAKDTMGQIAQGRMAKANLLHVVGHDEGKLVHRSSRDNGVTWSVRTVIADNADEYPLMYGGLAADGDNLYLLTADGYMGNEARHLDVRVSHDNGKTWEPRVRITDEDHKVFRGQIVVSGKYVHVAGMAHPRPDGKMLYFRSIDGGKTWNKPRVMAENLGPYGGGQSVAVDGSTVHLVYTKVRVGVGAGDTYYIRSTDNGETWSEPRIIGEQSDESSRQARVLIVARGNHLFTIWQRENDGKNSPLPTRRLGYNRSCNGGLTWIGADILPGEPVERDHPLIAMTELGDVHLTWRQGTDETSPVGYLRGSSFGGNWEQPRIIFDSKVPHQVSSVVSDDRAVHVLNGTVVLTSRP